MIKESPNHHLDLHIRLSFVTILCFALNAEAIIILLTNSIIRLTPTSDLPFSNDAAVIRHYAYNAFHLLFQDPTRWHPAQRLTNIQTLSPVADSPEGGKIIA